MLKMPAFLQSPEWPGEALEFGKVKGLEGELRLATERRQIVKTCFLCAVAIWSAAGRGVAVLQAGCGRHMPGRR